MKKIRDLFRKRTTYKIGKLFDSKGKLLKAGQVCECSPGTIAKEPYKVKISNCVKSNLYHHGKLVETPYLVTSLLSGVGHTAAIWPYWSKRLTVIK